MPWCTALPPAGRCGAALADRAKREMTAIRSCCMTILRVDGCSRSLPFRAAARIYQCIAVSQTSDPLGAYNRYAFTYQNMNDYPKFGVWPEAYCATYNMFQHTLFGWSFVGAKACAFDRHKMLAGLAATQQCFDLGTSYGGLLPSDADGASPASAERAELSRELRFEQSEPVEVPCRFF